MNYSAVLGGTWTCFLYFYEDRLHAVKHYIRLGKWTSATIGPLRCLTKKKKALKSGHRPYQPAQDLPVGYVRLRSEYSGEQKKVPAPHHQNHDRCLAQPLQALGSSGRETLPAWDDELHP